jgi:hypothetical protein
LLPYCYNSFWQSDMNVLHPTSHVQLQPLPAIGIPVCEPTRPPGASKVFLIVWSI